MLSFVLQKNSVTFLTTRMVEFLNCIPIIASNNVNIALMQTQWMWFYQTPVNNFWFSSNFLKYESLLFLFISCSVAFEKSFDYWKKILSSPLLITFARAKASTLPLILSELWQFATRQRSCPMACSKVQSNLFKRPPL